MDWTGKRREGETGPDFSSPPPPHTGITALPRVSYCCFRVLLPRAVAVMPFRCPLKKVRRVVAQLKQAEACRARLEQRCRFEGGGGGDGDGDASLLHHWVEELDEFEEGEGAFMDKMRWVPSFPFFPSAKCWGNFARKGVFCSEDRGEGGGEKLQLPAGLPV